MNQSPNRANVKRKMPEPFYRPTSTQASSLIQSSSSTPSVLNDIMPSSPSTTPNLVAAQPNPKSRIIHHAHTNSLPMMMPPQQTTTINATIIHHQHTYHHHPAMNMPQSTAVPSNNNGYVNTNMNPYQTSMYNQSGPYYQYGSPSTGMINHVQPPQQQNHVYAGPKQGSQTTETFGSPSIQAQHVKTYSLPVAFDGGGPGTVGNIPNLIATPSSSMQPPPIRPFNSQGDIPLPPGWDFQQAPNGQIYYINQMTKMTTWEDPRKTIYNLPCNQSEISADMRARIKATIPLPSGWEEAVAPSGEVYYIDHNNRTTSWDDPRLTIYMQQQQFKYQKQQQQEHLQHQYHNHQQHPPPHHHHNHHHSHQLLHHPSQNLTTQQTSLQFNGVSNSSSSSSLNGASLISNSSSSSSMQSLASSSVSSFALTSSSVSSVSSSSSNPSDSNEELVASLRKSLDELLGQKSQICKQLEELTQTEASLRAKLSPKDLEDVMQRLKNNLIVSQSEKLVELTSTQIKVDNGLETTLKTTKVEITSSVTAVNSNGDFSNTELDSTFVADTSSNNLNVSAS